MNGDGYDSLVAFIVTMDPAMWAMTLVIAALLAFAMLVFIPLGSTRGRMVLIFFAYWLVLTVIILFIVQNGIGRDVITIEVIPFKAQNFGAIRAVPLMYG